MKKVLMWALVIIAVMAGLDNLFFQPYPMGLIIAGLCFLSLFAYFTASKSSQ